MSWPIMVDFQLTALDTTQKLREEWRQFHGGERGTMRILLKIVKWLAGLTVLAIAGVAVWLYVAPPPLIRVASGYSAKIVCSNVFLAARDPDNVLRIDVQAPGHWLLGYMKVDVDRNEKTVTAALLGIFGKGVAVARDGLGCTSAPDGDVARVKAVTVAPAAAIAARDALWPWGNRVEPSQSPALMAILNDATLTGQGMRAVVVVQNGRVIAERYANGFSADTPLLGWSMTKTVTAAIIGTLVKDGNLAVGDKALFEPWKADGRTSISLADLMAMSSGLEFNEDYGDVTDVTRMLYLEPDMAGFAASKPLTGDVGKAWSYSSGTTVMLSRIWQTALGDPATALAWPRAALFAPIGMTSAVLETDEQGTFVGSSYLYATARDWARFGQFLLQDGAWNDTQILPVGFVSWMREEVPASKGEYGRGQLWLHGSDSGAAPGTDPDAGFDLPDDAFWMLGHDGQSVSIVPSKKLVVVRLGLTPSKLAYRAQGLLEALTKVLE
jgi:CubicO group peptidase (beta-lactamase class C family)